jgi:serine/threonine-protein kinase
MSDAHLRLVEDRPPSIPPPDPLVGRVLDSRYRIESVLGQGGMGLVYRARHAVLNKPLAIKVLKPEVSRDSEVISRFQQEAQSASGIGNHHIIDISDFGTLPDGSTYFVMEFLDGVSLTKAIEDTHPMPAPRVFHVAKQLGDALGAAHERSIVHRDLKPDNVYLIRRGSDADFVKVLDFGIAKVGGSSSKLTKAGQVFGTPHYMSPEQCAGSAVDQRTDIYALGVMLYEMSSGKVPFDADNLMGILTKHMYEQPIPPRELPPPVDVPPGLEAVILKCLAKSADARYQSMGELRTDLERLEAGTTPQAVVDAVDRASGTGRATQNTGRVALGQDTGLRMGVGEAPEPAKRSPMRWVALGLVALGAVGGGGYLALASTQQPAQVLTPDTSGSSGQPGGQGPPGGHGQGEAQGTSAGPGTTGVAGSPGTPPTGAPPTGTPPTGTPPTGADEGGTAPEGGSVVQPAQGVVTPAASAVRIETDPPGAEVLVGGLVLGMTPLDVPRPTTEPVSAVTLRLRGYREESLGITAVSPSPMQRTLTRVGGRPPRGGETSTGMAPDTSMAGGETTMMGAVGGGSDGILDPWQ